MFFFCLQIMFIYVNVAEENLAKPFLTLFGLEDSDKTVVSFKAYEFCVNTEVN